MMLINLNPLQVPAQESEGAHTYRSNIAESMVILVTNIMADVTTTVGHPRGLFVKLILMNGSIAVRQIECEDANKVGSFSSQPLKKTPSSSYMHNVTPRSQI